MDGSDALSHQEDPTRQYRDDLARTRLQHETRDPQILGIAHLRGGNQGLDTPFFLTRRLLCENGLDRYVVLNRVAGSVIESCRGKHPELVFTRNGRPITRIYN